MSRPRKASSNWEIRVIGTVNAGGQWKLPKNFFSPGPTAGALMFELRDRNNPEVVGTFAFLGLGLGIGFGRASAEIPEWVKFNTVQAVTLGDFEASARLTGLSAGLGFSFGAEKLTFHGISIDQGDFLDNLVGGDNIDLSGMSIGTSLSSSVVLGNHRFIRLF